MVLSDSSVSSRMRCARPVFRATWVRGWSWNHRITPKTPSYGRLAANMAVAVPQVRSVEPGDVAANIRGDSQRLEQLVDVVLVVRDVVGNQSAEVIGAVAAVVREQHVHHEVT